MIRLKTLQSQPKTKSDAGNVLFLILIAVALFAALSYAVTQSSRSGSGDASSETNLVNTAQIVQYPASIRTAILRMIVSEGVVLTDLEFNPPSDFGNCSSPDICVFHPSGGNATYAFAPGEVMADGNPGEWYFNMHYEGPLIGSSAAGAAGNDLIAFLPGIKQSICFKINDELGISNKMPLGDDEDFFTYATEYMDNTYTVPAFHQSMVYPAPLERVALDNHAMGCFLIGDIINLYTYYHVLMPQ